MKHYLHSVEEVFADVKSTENGLSEAEAQKRLQENGKNKLAEAKKDSIVKKFFDQMKDPMIIILIIAAAISAVTEYIEASAAGLDAAIATASKTLPTTFNTFFNLEGLFTGFLPFFLTIVFGFLGIFRGF